MHPIESGVEAWNISGLAAHRTKTFLPPPVRRSPIEGRGIVPDRRKV
jgi:hypothetical protein